MLQALSGFFAKADAKLTEAIVTKLYEHRISPTDPQVVEVREKKARCGKWRGIVWRTYMDCDSPAAANRILMMLKRDNVEATVRP